VHVVIAVRWLMIDEMIQYECEASLGCASLLYHTVKCEIDCGGKSIS